MLTADVPPAHPGNWLPGARADRRAGEAGGRGTYAALQSCALGAGSWLDSVPGCARAPSLSVRPLHRACVSRRERGRRGRLRPGGPVLEDPALEVGRTEGPFVGPCVRTPIWKRGVAEGPVVGAPGGEKSGHGGVRRPAARASSGGYLRPHLRPLCARPGAGPAAAPSCSRQVCGARGARSAAAPGTMNNPIPSNLKSEAKKAAKILREFTEITSRNGPDKIIPAHVIAKAKGLAVLSVIKAGFLVTARGGSGIVLARLPDGKWSAPSAIGIAGLGGGFEIGIEVSDLVIILNYDRAVEAFAKGGNLTLGGNFTVAVGPLGRNLEGNVALRSSAAVFTYCKSRGLFAGISLEGSCLIERKETNRKFYCQDIRAYDILFGDVPRPAQAEDLYEILDSFTEKYENEGQRINARKAAREQRKVKELPPKPSSRPQQPSEPGQLNSGSQSNRNEYKLYPELSGYHKKVDSSCQPVEVTALYSFEGQQPGDLSFQAGDRITVISKSDSQFDWWEGTLGSQTGIFPANYVSVD